MTLNEYLAFQSGRRWRWGAVDCVSFGLDWAREKTGRRLKPLGEWHSETEACAMLREGGGLERIVREWMSANGFEPTDAPEDGDIGVVPTAIVAGVVSDVAVMIRCGKWWVGKTPKGIASADVRRVPAWRI